MPEMDELLRELESGAGGHSRYYGLYRGTVVQNLDPLQRGRLQVTVPAVLGQLSYWAEACVPYAGPDLGFYFLPEVGTGVWIEFEAGDPNYPVWTGCFWNDGGVSPADSDPKIKFIKTNKFKLRIDDANGEIIIENDSGSQIKLTAQEILIKSSTVKEEASGGRKTDLSAAGFRVNDGSMEVL